MERETELEETLKKYNQLYYMDFQFSSVAQSCPTLCDPMKGGSGLPVHHQLSEFTQTHAHQVGDAIQHLILCRPLLLLPPIPLSIRVFSSESALHMRWPKSHPNSNMGKCFENYIIIWSCKYVMILKNYYHLSVMIVLWFYVKKERVLIF